MPAGWCFHRRHRSAATAPPATHRLRRIRSVQSTAKPFPAANCLPMSPLHPPLLGLLALAAVPVILHFLMRPKPKRLLFPALRLIESRKKTHVRRLRLRHVWLLLLRVALICLLVFAIARPLVPAANYGLTTGELLGLLGVAALCAAAYAAAVRWWGRQAAARHEFLYRRTLLRAGT